MVVMKSCIVFVHINYLTVQIYTNNLDFKNIFLKIYPKTDIKFVKFSLNLKYI